MIKKWVDMSSEVEIEIGVDDIRAALAESFEESKKHLTGTEGNRNGILRAIDNIGGFLRAVTDQQIEGMTYGQRTTIEKFFSEQAARFKVAPENVPFDK